MKVDHHKEVSFGKTLSLYQLTKWKKSCWGHKIIIIIPRSLNNCDTMIYTFDTNLSFSFINSFLKVSVPSIYFFVPPFSRWPVCHWRRATLTCIGRGRHAPLAWPVRLSPAPSIAIVWALKMMRAKARRTNTVLWCGMATIVRGAVRAPVTESAKGAETVLEPAPGERGRSFVGHVEK